MAGLILPSLFGGEQTTISLQPAILAGMPSIKKVLGNTAVPPGIYSPTFSIALASRQQVTPGMVSIFASVFSCV
ncbi:hypothetical protein D9M68_797180 [compost metagenome]